MGSRAEALAERFHQARAELIAIIERSDPQQMQAHCHGEQCTVAALASHVAGIHAFGADWVQKAVRGEPLAAITMDEANAMTAEQMARDADRNKEDVLRELRQNGDAAEHVVRGVRDEELDRTVLVPLFDGEMTIERLIEYVVIGDVEEHLQSIKAATRSGG